METKAKKETPAKKDDAPVKEPSQAKEPAKAKAEPKKNDADDTKAAKKSDDTAAKSAKKNAADDKKSGDEFREFFVDELKDILWAEKALLKALPKMSKAATGKELKASFDAHVKETEGQIATLEQVFEAMGAKPATKKCDAMEGLISEAESIIEDTDKGTAIRDAGLILAAQKVEHYEIATYGTLAALADAMKEKDVAKMLRSILRDEKGSDKKLTALALESVNEAAAEE